MSQQEQPEAYEIDDPEELSQKQRIKEILNRRTGVIDKRTEAKDLWVSGELSQVQALQVYKTAIEGLIMDLWTKFLNAEDADGEELLQEKPIATIEVHPPADKLPTDAGDLAAGATIPDPKAVTIRGLEWYLNNEPVIERQFTLETWHPPQTTTVVGRALVDFPILDRAVYECVEFIDGTGIDADMAEEEQKTEIDRDLLEEVDEWRQKNVD